MQKFIARENLKLLERKLAEACDQNGRDRLTALMEKARERLRQLTEAGPSS